MAESKYQWVEYVNFTPKEYMYCMWNMMCRGSYFKNVFLSLHWLEDVFLFSVCTTDKSAFLTTTTQVRSKIKHWWAWHVIKIPCIVALKFYWSSSSTLAFPWVLDSTQQPSAWTVSRPQDTKHLPLVCTGPIHLRMKGHYIITMRWFAVSHCLDNFLSCICKENL